MAKTKSAKNEAAEPDKIGIPFLLDKWLEIRRSSVVVVEKWDGELTTVVTWFDSDGNHHKHVGEAGRPPCSIALDAWDAGSVIEQTIFRRTFPTWYAQMLRSPMEDILAAWREGTEEDDSE